MEGRGKSLDDPEHLLLKMPVAATRVTLPPVEDDLVRHELFGYFGKLGRGPEQML